MKYLVISYESMVAYQKKHNGRSLDTEEVREYFEKNGKYEEEINELISSHIHIDCMGEIDNRNLFFFSTHAGNNWHAINEHNYSMPHFELFLYENFEMYVHQNEELKVFIDTILNLISQNLVDKSKISSIKKSLCLIISEPKLASNIAINDVMTLCYNPS
jgi:hypothetical protein